MNSPQQAHSGRRRSQSRLQMIVAPLVVLLLLGQFAPVGLLTSGWAADHDCPHCAGTMSHGAMPTKCMHPGVDAEPQGHHGMSTAHHSERRGEASFCGCGTSGTSLTIVPPIGKTLAATVSAAPAPRSLDLAFAEPRDHAQVIDGSNLFHPPRFV